MSSSQTQRRGVALPLDGSVNLPETVDFHRKHNPTLPIYKFVEDGAPNITEISHLEFGRAGDRVAHYLRPGRRGPEREVVAVLALSDSLLYHTVLIGIMRAGLIPYPMSPRNTAEATIKLLKDTSCHRLLATKTTLKLLIDEIQDKLAGHDPSLIVSIEEVPPFHEIYPKLGREQEQDPFEPYPSGPRPPLDDVCIYLHSSGSTGLPKSIPQKFRSILSWASFPVNVDLREQLHQPIIATQPLPSFHMFGFATQLVNPLYSLSTSAFYPPVATTKEAQPMQATPQSVIDHSRRTGCTGMYVIPAWLQIWAQDAHIVEFLATLDFVGYSGGPLPSTVGDRLVEAGVHLVPVYGGTEFGPPSSFLKGPMNKEDWEYIFFSQFVKTRWIDQGDGTYELQFLSCDTHQLGVENLPDVKGYATSDLWLPHPTKPNLWKIIGRKDDVIIHTSGEKTVPAPIENILMSSPYIIGVTMFGRERDQPGVLVELDPDFAVDVDDNQEVIKARNLVWPVVEEANNIAPSFSRLYKEFILIVSPKKPLPRAGKGTVMSKAALKVYSKEIDDLYAKVGAAVDAQNVVPPAFWSPEGVEAWLISQITEINSNKKPLSSSGDLFEQGLDSLGATILRHRIVGALQASENTGAGQLVTPSTIYEHSSVSKLAGFIIGAVTNSDRLPSTSSKVDEIENMIKKYSSTVLASAVKWDAAEDQTTRLVVLITGTTGNLGAQLVDTFLRDARITKVYTLNRPSSGEKNIKMRHEERFMDKGLDISLLSDDRLVFLEGDASSGAKLGLTDDVYQELQRRVNLIIHNAWRLDFNLSLSSFESNIRGTKHLIDFARTARYSASLKFLFTSSVTSANSWDRSKGGYPEEVVLNAEYAVGNGYGEGKYVAERILAQSGLQFTSFRIGQVSGGLPNGAWASTDWVPIFVKSSLILGALPSAAGIVSWLPMHAVAHALLDVALSSGTKTEQALNIVHPRPISWASIISAVNDALVREDVVKDRLPVVEFSEWFKLLESKAHQDSSAKQIHDIPAIKLIEFFRGFAQVDQAVRQRDGKVGEVGGQPAFSTEKVQYISGTMKELPLLGEEDAAMWVKYWKGVGLFEN